MPKTPPNRDHKGSSRNMQKKLSAATLLLASLVCLAATTYNIDEVMAAIQQVESGGNPYAMFDNSGKKSYQPKDAAEALAIITRPYSAKRPK